MKSNIPGAASSPHTMRRTKDHTKSSNGQSLADWIVKRAGLRRRNTGNLERAPSTVDSQLDHHIDRVKQLLDIAQQQATELSSERKKRQRAEREMSEVRDLLKESERSRRQDRHTLRRASRELNALRRDSKPRAVIELREKIEQIHQQYADALAEEQTRHAEAASELKTVKEKLQTLQKARTQKEIHDRPSASERVDEERARRRKAEKESKKLKQNLRHASRSLNSLRSEHKKCGRQTYRGSSNGSVSKHDFIGAVLPNLTVARDGDSRLIKARDTKQVFDDLTRLNDSPQIMRGERVGAAEPWLEIRPTLTDRIYYRQEKGRGRYLVLIGDKNTQDNDLDWMKKNK